MSVLLFHALPPQPKMQKIVQHFVWVMVVRCGAYEGGEPTMRKGSYSEELVKDVVDACDLHVDSRTL